MGRYYFLDSSERAVFARKKQTYLIDQLQVQTISKKPDLSTSLVNGVLSAGCFNNDFKEFDIELNYLLKNYNFNGYKIFNKNEIKHQISSDIYKSGLLNLNSYHINPLKFLIGLANELKKLNVKIFENTPVLSLVDHRDYIKVNCKKNTIKAKKVVVACNGYLDNLLNNKSNIFMPINNYVIATEPLGKEKAKEIIHNNYAVCILKTSWMFNKCIYNKTIW